MQQLSLDSPGAYLSLVPEGVSVEGSLVESDTLYRALVDTSPDAIIVTDFKLKIIFCNLQAASLYGCDNPAALVGCNALKCLSQANAARVLALIRNLFRTGAASTIECELQRQDGTSFPAEISASFVTDAEGKPVAFRGVVHDITERKCVEHALRASEQRYRELFERNLVGLYRTDVTGRILDCNDAMAHLLGCRNREELLGCLATDFYFDLADRNEVLNQVHESSGLTNKELRLRRKDGTPIWVLESAHWRDWEEGHPAVLDGTFIDITQRKMLEEQLTHLAFHDALTGLPNRALFMDRLQHALARSRRAGEFVAVLFLDLDNFKLINDSMGHKIGDKLLVAVGERLRNCMRSFDTVARLGGDEFTLLVENIRAMKGATEVAERVADTLNAPFMPEGREVFLNTSVGIVISAGDEPPDELLRNADLAMYHAKNSGKARYAVYEPAFNRRI